MTTGTPIDSSIRKMLIKNKASATNLPDSESNLDPAPQIIMEEKPEAFSFQFEDGLGLHPDFQPQYDGYVGAGGASAVIGNTPGVSPQPEILYQTNGGDEGVRGQADTINFVSDFGQISISGRTATIELDDAAIKETTIDDFTTALVIKPTNRSYIIMFNLPFDVEVTDSVYAFGTGPGSVTLPANGTYTTGSDISFTVTGTSVASANLSVRVSTRTVQSG